MKLYITILSTVLIFCHFAQAMNLDQYEAQFALLQQKCQLFEICLNRLEAKCLILESIFQNNLPPHLGLPILEILNQDYITAKEQSNNYEYIIIK